MMTETKNFFTDCFHDFHHQRFISSIYTLQRQEAESFSTALCVIASKQQGQVYVYKVAYVGGNMNKKVYP